MSWCSYLGAGGTLPDGWRRPGERRIRAGNPNAAATAIAAELGAALTTNPELDLTAFSSARQLRGPSTHNVMADGRVTSRSSQLRVEIERQARAMLAAKVPDAAPRDQPIGPVRDCPTASERTSGRTRRPAATATAGTTGQRR